ncbi:MAG: hypothetical protein AB1679_19075 [Actinomycetota bacterium]
MAQRCLCAGILTLALTACNNGGNGRPDRGGVAQSAPSTTTTSSATTTAGNAQAAVIDAYLAYWRTVVAYGSEAAPFDPNEFKNRFSIVAVGAQYDSLFNTFQLDRAKGWVYRGSENDQHRPQVAELSGDRAVVIDCADDFGGIFDTRENVYVQPLTPGQYTKIIAVLQRADGTWKVSTQGGNDERCQL